MPYHDRIRWIRWLSARALPRADVARVLGCPEASVDEALRPRRAGPPRKTGRPPGAGKLRGRVGAWCRRLAELGHGPGRIGELLGIEPARVEDFFIRLEPRQCHPKRRGATLNRPRSRREQERLSDWAWAGDHDRDAAPAMVPVPEASPARARPMVTIPAPEPYRPAEPVEWDGPVMPHGYRDDGTHAGRVKGRPKRRARPAVRPDDPRVKLDPEARRDIRRRYAAGDAILSLAEEYRVDPTTIRALLRGRTFAGDRAKPIAPPPLEPTIGQRQAAAQSSSPAPAVPSSPAPLPPPSAPIAPPGRGKGHPARPSPELCEEIRRLHREEGLGVKPLAKRTGLDRKRIRRILEGDDGTRSGPAGRMTPEQRAEARELSRQGWGCVRLAKRYGVHKKTMWALLHGEHHRDDPGAPPPRRRPEQWDRDPKDPMHRDPTADDVVAPGPAEDLDPPEVLATPPVDRPGHEWDGPPSVRPSRDGPGRPRKIDDGRMPDLRQWDADGVSMAEMGRRLGVSRPTVAAALRRAGIVPVRSRSAGDN
jgi:hypothetical protein